MSTEARRRRIVRARTLAAWAACVVLPGLSYLVPASGRAWAMYTSTTCYRIGITVIDRRGARHAFAVASLIPRTSAATGTALRGSATWRHGSVLTLPAHLAGLACLACDDPRVAAVEVVLATRTLARTADATDRATCACPPAP